MHKCDTICHVPCTLAHAMKHWNMHKCTKDLLLTSGCVFSACTISNATARSLQPFSKCSSQVSVFFLGSDVKCLRRKKFKDYCDSNPRQNQTNVYKKERRGNRSMKCKFHVFAIYDAPTI